MDHIQLKCFISVARTLSFSEAARRNYLSQSTVSRYIKDLEKEFGVKLFERTRREVSLTNEGRRFNKKYPDIAVEMVKLSGSDSESAINSTDYDFFFMLRDMLPDNDNIDSEITHKDNLKLLVPKSLKTSGKNETGVNLKNQKFVLLSEFESPILYMEIMDIFRTFHFSPNSIVEFDDVRSVYMAVSAGMGVSVLPSGLADSYSATDVRAVDISGIETDLTYVMAWRKNNSNLAAHLFLKTVGRGNIADDEEYVL